MADQTPLTPEAVEHANVMLSFLSDQADPDWNKVMTETLTDSEVESNTRTMRSKFDEFNIEDSDPVGAVLGGTGVAKENSGLSGEDGQVAIQILKQTGRIQQCGRGRGKCLIVLSSAPVEPQSTSSPEPSAPVAAVAQEEPAQAVQQDPSPPEEVDESEGMIDASDVSTLARAIRDAHRSLQREFNETKRTVRKLEKDKKDLLTELEEEREKVRNMEAQLEHQQVASWA